MTARLYSRVSTQGQTENYSLPAQRARLEAWAAYQGIAQTTHYEDAGISGARDDRPGLSAMLLDLREGDVVVAYALSRLARGGAVQLLGLVRDIRERGARLVSLQENIDTDTPTGRLMLTILAALAELEIEQTKERTDMGRTQAALQGVYPHNRDSLPLGWTTDEAGRIVEDARHSDTVRRIIRAGPAPYLATATELNREGVASARGGRWTVVQVRRIVLFDGYWTGQFNYRARSHPDEPDAHILIPAPALVTREEWEAAQRTARTNHRHRRPDLFPLTGHLRCACGARMAGRQNHGGKAKPHHVRHPYYVCFDHVRKTPLCPINGKRLHMERAESLHAQARAQVAALLRDPADPVHVAAAYAPPLARRPAQQAQDLLDTERKLAALLDLYLEQVIDRATYDARRATLSAHAASLAPTPIAPPPAMPARADLAEAALTCPPEELAELLDILDVDFTVQGGQLRLIGFRPLAG